ncbi:MAG: glycoside hydrolase family 57 [Methylohalobius sp.]|nr:glycoside hydrolase family 57 [Methylohalobius sp.]
MAQIFHALGLHMHQPPGNLKLLLDSNPWEAEQIIRCYERAARYAHRYPDGVLHVGFSGILLEQLQDPEIIDRYRPFVDIPKMLESYAQAGNIELLGMGYFHPIFPLIPQTDWEDQLISGRRMVEQVFGRSPKGFWPPEMAFCMEMIPALVKAGYEYVVVDGVHVQPHSGVLDLYQPYRASYGGATITVIPRDRDLSNAQESGLDPIWFFNEVRHKVAQSPHPDIPRLITTWSDGENGGWFRQMHEESGFFGRFFAPYLEAVRSGQAPMRPLAISQYLRDHPPVAESSIRTGAWNVGATSGLDFSQWAGTESQRQAVAKICAVSARYWRIKSQEHKLSPHGKEALAKARKLILEGETSCFLFWGEAWVPELYKRTEPAERHLAAAEAELF